MNKKIDILIYDDKELNSGEIDSFILKDRELTEKILDALNNEVEIIPLPKSLIDKIDSYDKKNSKTYQTT